MKINIALADCIEGAGIDTVLSLPCNLLAGLIAEIDRRSIKHVPVCREEEGVGIAAGIALAGKRPMLILQNSGLGNSINALLSLTQLYKLPLFMLISQRGDQGEPIAAQVPMGRVTTKLLTDIGIAYMLLNSKNDIATLGKAITQCFAEKNVGSALISREFWNVA